MPSRRIRVAFVGSDFSRLLHALKDTADIEVIYNAPHPEAVGSRTEQAHVLLLSALLPDVEALPFVQRLIEMEGGPRVMMIDLPNSEGAVLRYLEAGAHGYAFQGDPPERILTKIRALHEGKSLVSPEVAKRLISRLHALVDLCEEKGIDLRRTLGLTQRELEVLSLIKRGFSNRRIAEELRITVGTVKSHVNRILKKLDVSSREAAAEFLPKSEASVPPSGPRD